MARAQLRALKTIQYYKPIGSKTCDRNNIDPNGQKEAITLASGDSRIPVRSDWLACGYEPLIGQKPHKGQTSAYPN